MNDTGTIAVSRHSLSMGTKTEVIAGARSLIVRASIPSYPTAASDLRFIIVPVTTSTVIGWRKIVRSFDGGREKQISSSTVVIDIQPLSYYFSDIDKVVVKCVQFFHGVNHRLRLCSDCLG